MLRFFCILLGFGMLSGCGQFVYFDGPYEGRVIEAHTRRPIEGAAVLAIWWTESGLLVPHPIESVHDAKETVTDAQGNFTIEGTRNVTLNPTFRVKSPQLTIFKPGYGVYRGPVVYKGTLIFDEDPNVFPVRLLETKEERLKNLDSVYVPACLRQEEHSRLCLPKEKFSTILRLKESEYENLGLKAKSTKKGDSK